MGGAQSRYSAPSHVSPAAIATDDDHLRAALAHHLRNAHFETLDSVVTLQVSANRRKISGAIFTSLEPKLVCLLIADARISIVLALQRHLNDEQYRRRLVLEPHYRAFLPHLSADFRVMMMPPSNWNGFSFPVSRNPNLINAYQNEIERLEIEIQWASEKMIWHGQGHISVNSQRGRDKTTAQFQSS